ncbi:MAG: hypothetical protein RI907_3893 [Pseudomonadota bacterium]|jgi:hypothetical protein
MSRVQKKTLRFEGLAGLGSFREALAGLAKP